MVGRHDSIEQELYQAFKRNECEFISSEELIEELRRVLTYEAILALGVTPAIAVTVVYHLLHLGSYYDEVETFDWPSLSDKKDWYLLDLLFASNADALITRDKAVLKAGKSLNLPVIHPEELRNTELLSSD